MQQAYRHRDKSCGLCIYYPAKVLSQAFAGGVIFAVIAIICVNRSKKIRQTQTRLQEEEAKLVSCNRKEKDARDELALEINR